MITIPVAEKVLWDLKDLESNATTAQRGQLREALQALQASADYLMFGVCADEQLAGRHALTSYAQNFGYEITPNLEQELTQIAGPVYLKFNPRSQRLYMDGYTGSYRGVLVSFQSDFADGYSGTHGHFPLDLFVD